MGVPGAEMVEYYRERAEGGVSLIIGEGVAINHPTSTSYFKYARFFGEAVEGWRRILEAVKRHDGRLFMQLWHQGAVRKENEGPHPGAPTLSPSGLLMAGQPVGRANDDASFVVCAAQLDNATVDVGTALISSGVAFAAAYPSGAPVSAAYAVAESIAKDNRSGLWAGRFTHPVSMLLDKR